MWTQVVGKVCLALTPKTNHYWNVAFHIAPLGLTTPLLVNGGKAFSITFDLVRHRLEIACSEGSVENIPLRAQSVAAFYSEFMAKLDSMGLGVRIWPMPVEVPNPVRFDLDETHHSYDPDRAEAFWRALLAMKPVFDDFRCGFVGKCSPLHFFWGSFDLAVTRFSGRRAPERPGADAVTKEAYSHEVISHGFWPGSGPVEEAAFYAYAAPEPAGLSSAPVAPAAAFYHPELREFILPYDAVRLAASPEAELRSFLDSTYEAGARLAGWDREALER
ncbi:MAG TPA: DUF5996 family protein, partial [Fimbriimonadaceae bacterium]|nr:DUF5996 family protein [Fimbriimonadaceae bacterium]